MRREIFTDEHEAFRDMVRAFIAREVTPHHERWERDGVVSRDVWLAAGRAGLLGIDIDEKYGGGGEPDYRYYAIMNEEFALAGANGPGFFVHNDMIGRYLDRLCTPEQRERWLPGYCSGEIITAIAMTEPGAGSDLQGIRTTAVPAPSGEFVMAELATELEVARAFTDRAIMAHVAGELTAQEAAMVKWWNTELCNRACDRCVQLHGGFGYMEESWVSRYFRDSRLLSIGGGSDEVMLQILARLDGFTA